MAVTADIIRDQFPELAKAAPELIESKLADAEALTAATISPDPAFRDQVVKYLTAHLIALSPRGEFARLDPKKEPSGASTIYERHLIWLRQTVSGPVVI